MITTTPYIKKGYNKQIFATLVESFSRLFLCDEEIVICDLLLHTERSLCDKDIELAIGIPDRRVREICSKMYKQRYLAKDTAAGVPINEGYDAPIYKSTDKTAGISVSREMLNSQCFYRLSNYLVLTVYYKIKVIEELLQNQKEKLYESDMYICPSCDTRYDGLEVQSCQLDPQDSHFLCSCKTKLVLDDVKKKQDHCESKIRRFEHQTRELKKHLSAAWGMQIPVFPIFNRNKPANIASLETPFQRMLLKIPNPVTSLPERVKNEEPEPEPPSEAKNGALTDQSVKDSSQNTASPASSTVGRSEPITIPFIPKRPASNVGKSENTNRIKFRMKTSMNLGFKRPHLQPTAGRLAKTVEPVVVVSTETAKEIPKFFISKLNAEYSLEEAESLQDDMTVEEFKEFSELYDKYLNSI